MKLTSILFTLILAVASTVLQADTVTMIKHVPYSADSKIRQNIKNECTALGSKISDFTVQFSKKTKNDIVLTESLDKTSSGKVLEVFITDAVSSGNAFVGHRKFVAVEGTLYEGGEKVASFQGSRYSGGGAFGGYKGSCSVLGRCSKAIGKDIANWLKNPTDGASLGDG